MNKQTEALKMAKEMLLELNGHKIVTPDGHIVIDTSKQIKALKMAIEAIEKWSDDGGDECIAAIQACKEALEQPATPKNCTSLDEYIAELEKDADFKELMKQKRAELLALFELEQPAQHKWSADGERCVKCGDKDWMGGSCSIADEQPAQEYLTRAQQVIRANNSAQEPVECPYPCGWNNLYSIIIKKGAYLAQSTIGEDEIFTDHQRNEMIQIIEYAKMLCRWGKNTHPAPSCSCKDKK